jgi:hypothetical protein
MCDKTLRFFLQHTIDHPQGGKVSLQFILLLLCSTFNSFSQRTHHYKVFKSLILLKEHDVTRFETSQVCARNRFTGPSQMTAHHKQNDTLLWAQRYSRLNGLEELQT